MTNQRLAEIICGLRRELEATDRVIALMEHLAGLRPRRARQPKVRLSVVRREPRR